VSKTKFVKYIGILTSKFCQNDLSPFREIPDVVDDCARLIKVIRSPWDKTGSFDSWLIDCLIVIIEPSTEGHDGEADVFVLGFNLRRRTGQLYLLRLGGTGHDLFFS
jgi:hypothetical protein